MSEARNSHPFPAGDAPPAWLERCRRAAAEGQPTTIRIDPSDMDRPGVAEAAARLLAVLIDPKETPHE